jgi:hypothetical protein
MSEKDITLDTNQKRNKAGIDYTTRNINLPLWMEKIIRAEAMEKEKSASLVVTYLIYSGLKAHVGEFRPPADNSIMRNYIARGKRWE